MNPLHCMYFQNITSGVMDSKWLKRSLVILSLSVASEVIWQLYVYFKQENMIDQDDEETKARNTRKPPTLWNTVLFFPDTNKIQVAPDTTSTPNGLSATATQLLSYLESAKMCIKICIQLASFVDLQKIILQKKKDGLSIQVITDHDTMIAHNNFCCHTFLRAGIPLRTRNTGHLMHNKFIIVDDEALITGSLNYTGQAFASNMENIVVTTIPRIVTRYRHQFEVLWRQSDEATFPYSQK